ncbi:MAG: acyl-CoA dehydrogenase [Pseudomonadota bacterium]|nr:acyl-CoA dehydrogenase [Pseudomonadota bacterium]
MSNYRVSLRELRFFLWELHAIEPRVLSQAPYLGIDRARVDRLLDDASAFAHALGECNPAGDREGCRLDATGAVQVPASYGPLWERLRRDWATLLVGGRLAPTREPARAIPVVACVAEPGVVPPLLAQVVCEMFMGANPSFMTYGGFNRAAVKLLRLHGTPAQRDWIDPLSTWRWDACFCATEAQAGSDLSAVTTRARALPDGSYALRGEKLYVSAGRHDLTENTLYVVLGRVDTAPSDGFSLSCFIVPRLNFDSGAAPVSNHVDCVALPRKMGLNGCANAHLVFGAKGTTRAYLLGNRHNVALLQLRPLMNQARTGSAMFGVGVASSSYLHAAAYARSRIQGRPIERAADARAARVALVEHGDVQRMLLDMKSRVEGCRGLLGKLSAAVTQASILEADPDADPAAAERCRKLAGLLTPVCKAFISDESWHVCTQAVQVHGGRGYTDACPVEQNSRDVRILSIWEGTNYVQSQDLVRDKLGFGRHAILMRYFREALDASLAQRAANAADPVFACWFAQLRAAAEALERSLACLGAAVQAGAMAASSQFFTRFLAMFGMTGAAWALLEAACVAQPRLADPHVAKNREESAFYRGKLKSAGHYYANILPLVHTHAAAIAAIGDAAWTASADELVSP